ncbi:MAG: exodeoxyribonuclease VII small subunit [Coriobacteriaceae bacterium]|nr:exodeoxyribonuclease VII small subunit [Coriobacteriaceae bacterium]
MGDDERSFTQVKARLEEIASEAAKKDTPLEKCLDLLEEGERLARRCTELIDQTEWRAAAGEQEDADEEPSGASAEEDSEETAADEVTEVEPAGSEQDS